MGGYMLDDGRKLQTHEYIEYLENRLEGALFLSEEEKQALLRFSQAGDDESIWDFTKAEREQFWSARQKLEESLKGEG